jgi:hypothetical protein
MSALFITVIRMLFVVRRKVSHHANQKQQALAMGFSSLPLPDL